MFYILDVAGFRNYLLVPGLPIGLQRSGKNYPTSPLMYLLVGGRLRDSLLVLWWIIFNWTLSLLQIWKTDVGDPRSLLLSLVMNAWLGDLALPPAMLPDGRQRRGRWRTPVPAEIPNLGTCRVIVHLIDMLARRPLIRRADSQVM